jgi:2-keto-3-deoxy-L-arabinonate dehydratase
MMPPYHGAALKADEAGMLEHFKRVAEAGGLPIMVQDAPLSGVALSVPFLTRLASEVPLVSYFKIEVPGTAAKLRALIKAGGERIVGPFDGEEAITLLADLDAGATGTMTSAMYSDLVKPIVTAHRQTGLRGTKAVFKEGGVIASEAVRHPLEPLDAATRQGLLELAREANPLALRWGK